jgi:hypothetical protein
VGISSSTSYQSSLFGSLQPTKKYEFEILLQGDVGSALGHGKFYGISITSNPAGLDFEYSRQIMESLVEEEGQEKYVYFFRLRGTVRVIETVSSLRVAISHRDGSRNMTVTGKAYIREVTDVT